MSKNAVAVNDAEMKKVLADKLEGSLYTIDDLLEILRLLRAPDGCPWDREQNHETIRTNLLEETHEALEAIDTHNTEGLCEELGDVLLQVAFHARIAQETDEFTWNDVVDGVCRKMVVRHPHVFADVQASTSEEVLKNWDAIKRRTKQETGAELLRSVPRTLPALMRAAKVQTRARRAGAPLPSGGEALDAVEAAVARWRQVQQSGGKADETVVGELLLSIVVAAGTDADVDSEQALTRAIDRYIRQFEQQEHTQG